MLKNTPILHVEDNEDDQFFLRRAFNAAEVTNTIHVVNDGQAAIDYLSGEGHFADRAKYALPCLVILDLKMPKVHGLEVLKWIRSNPDFKSVIVIILSSSPLRDDVNTAYHGGANSFIVKPLTSEQMSQIARLIKEYWLETNELPNVGEKEEAFKMLNVKPMRPHGS